MTDSAEYWYVWQRPPYRGVLPIRILGDLVQEVMAADRDNLLRPDIDGNRRGSGNVQQAINLVAVTGQISQGIVIEHFHKRMLGLYQHAFQIAGRFNRAA